MRNLSLPAAREWRLFMCTAGIRPGEVTESSAIPSIAIPVDKIRERCARMVALSVLVASTTVACAGAAPARSLAPARPLPRSARGGTGTRNCPSSMIRAVVARANEARRHAHLRSLVADESLTRAAGARARTMAAERQLSHDGWDSVVHGDATAGENIAYNYPTADAVMRGWLASPGHRANILRAAYRRIGVGCVVDPSGKRWWSQAFAD